MAELVMRGHWARVCDRLRSQGLEITEDPGYVGKIESYGVLIERVDEIVLRDLRDNLVKLLASEANRYRAKAMHVRAPLAAYETPTGAYMVDVRVAWEPFSDLVRA